MILKASSKKWPSSSAIAKIIYKIFYGAEALRTPKTLNNGYNQLISIKNLQKLYKPFSVAHGLPNELLGEME